MVAEPNLTVASTPPYSSLPPNPCFVTPVLSGCSLACRLFLLSTGAAGTQALRVVRVVMSALDVSN